MFCTTDLQFELLIRGHPWFTAHTVCTCGLPDRGYPRWHQFLWLPVNGCMGVSGERNIGSIITLTPLAKK